jgi:flagellar basal body-associated protein FliL
VIKNMDVERAKKTRTAEEFIKTVGVPTKERDLLKNEIKQDVNTHLSENSKVTELYEEIISP